MEDKHASNNEKTNKILAATNKAATYKPNITDKYAAKWKKALPLTVTQLTKFCTNQHYWHAGCMVLKLR